MQGRMSVGVSKDTPRHCTKVKFVETTPASYRDEGWQECIPKHSTFEPTKVKRQQQVFADEQHGNIDAAYHAISRGMGMNVQAENCSSDAEKLKRPSCETHSGRQKGVQNEKGDPPSPTHVPISYRRKQHYQAESNRRANHFVFVFELAGVCLGETPFLTTLLSTARTPNKGRTDSTENARMWARTHTRLHCSPSTLAQTIWRGKVPAICSCFRPCCPANADACTPPQHLQTQNPTQASSEDLHAAKRQPTATNNTSPACRLARGLQAHASRRASSATHLSPPTRYCCQARGHQPAQGTSTGR